MREGEGSFAFSMNEGGFFYLFFIFLNHPYRFLTVRLKRFSEIVGKSCAGRTVANKKITCIHLYNHRRHSSVPHQRRHVCCSCDHAANHWPQRSLLGDRQEHSELWQVLPVQGFVKSAALPIDLYRISEYS